MAKTSKNNPDLINSKHAPIRSKILPRKHFSLSFFLFCINISSRFVFLESHIMGYASMMKFQNFN